MSTPPPTPPNRNANEQQPPPVDGTKIVAAVSGTLIFFAIWGLLGLAGLITSFVCFGMEGTMSIKIGGILMALILGPFYWIYFGILRSQKKYCMSKMPETLPAVVEVKN